MHDASASNFSLSESEHQRIQSILAKFQTELRAQLALLINRNGQSVIISGQAETMDCTSLASLAAAQLAATDSLAAIIGEKDFPVLVHQGRHRSLLISDVLKKYLLVLVFDSSVSSGLIRYKCKKNVQLLEEILGDFHRRIGKNSQMSIPQFTDEEIEELLRIEG
jgi:predicted regulator of Ras-like GTPase activity (Roadblock/LC7/MglB family)